MGQQQPIHLETDHVTWTATGEEVVILDLRTSHYLQLNDTAALLWQRLAAGATCDELAHDLTATYDITPGQAAADVAAFIDDLVARNLVAR